MGEEPPDRTANRVELVGTLSAPPDVKDLSSGSRLVLLKMVVDRPDGSRRDSLPVVVGPPPDRGRHLTPGQADTATVRRAAALDEGARVTVRGWLKRHFWQAPEGTRTRLQVVAAELDAV